MNSPADPSAEAPAVATVRSALDAIVTMDAGGRIIGWNPAAERTFGYSEAEAVGRLLADLIIPARLRAPHRAAIARYAATQQPRILDRRIETTGLRSNGTEFPVELGVTRLEGAGGGGEFVFTAHLRDISERRRTQQLLALREAEERSLHRVCLAVARDGEPEEIFDLVAREVAELLGASGGVVVRFERAHEATVVGSHRTGELLVPDTIPLGGQTVVDLVQRTRAPARVADYRRQDDPGSRLLASLHYRGSVGAPITIGARLWGAVVAADGEPARFHGADEERLARFAEPLALAVANAEVGERIVSDTAATIFASQLQMEPTLRAIAGGARRALRAHRATCYLISRDGTVCESVYTTETDPAVRGRLEGFADRPVSDFPLWEALLERPDRVLVVEDTSKLPGRGIGRRLGVGALIGVRLEHSSVRESAGGPMLGALFVSFSEPRGFSIRERAAARSLGSMASVAVANARLHAQTVRSLEEAQERAALDSLTGLLNHRTFQERLAGEVARALRHRRPLSLALFDLDHFKRVNDTHGHLVGDEVLVEVARRLSAASRPGDTMARIGGEEFAWLLPETDGAAAYEAAERARTGIASEPAGIAGTVTVSAGVCDLAQAGTAEELLRKADGALYWAKVHGRDVTYGFTPEVVEVLSAQERADQLERMGALNAMRALARAIDAKDPSTRRHSERVARTVELLALTASWNPQRAALLREAALVHDVGKIGVPDAILLKPMNLTREEYDLVKRHAALGADIAAEVLSPDQVAWIRHHHERWSGGGYPDGISGEEIPYGARLLAVADAWDAMTSARPYQRARSIEQALRECVTSAGTHLCPSAVEVLGGCWRKLAEVRAEEPRAALA